MGFACVHTERDTQGDRATTQTETHERQTQTQTETNTKTETERRRQTDKDTHPIPPPEWQRNAENDFQQGIKLGRDGTQSGDQDGDCT